jgi:hypothetical protein
MFQFGHSINKKTYQTLINDLKKCHPTIDFNFSNITEEWYEEFYKNGKTPLPIICPHHGIINRCYEYFKRTSTGCVICAKSQPPKSKIKSSIIGRNQYRIMNREEAIKDFRRIHGDLYDYSEFIYKRSVDKSIAICPIEGHGKFLISHNTHSSPKKVGCPRCAGRNLTTEIVVDQFKKIHGDLYDYSKFIYKSAIEKSIVICNKHNHGEFLISPNNHKRGKGCPMCVNKTQVQVYSFIKDTFDYMIIYERSTDWSPRHRYDIIIEELKLIIEIDGRQHFMYVPRFKNNVELSKDNDKYKTRLAIKNGYSIIRIYQEDIYNNVYNWKELLSKYIKLYMKPTIITIGDIYDISNYY